MPATLGEHESNPESPEETLFVSRLEWEHIFVHHPTHDHSLDRSADLEHRGQVGSSADREADQQLHGRHGVAHQDLRLREIAHCGLLFRDASGREPTNAARQSGSRVFAEGELMSPESSPAATSLEIARPVSGLARFAAPPSRFVTSGALARRVERPHAALAARDTWCLLRLSSRDRRGLSLELVALLRPRLHRLAAPVEEIGATIHARIGRAVAYVCGGAASQF
ncbi:MAG TPA: hypothetical protein VMH32_11265 [Burkholderiales bacterium]|nr:hypothetical protein [Burkholderiales bacterium]